MVGKMSYGNSIYGALTYNESKVEKGEAEVIAGDNLIKDVENATFAEKHFSLQSRADLNERTKKNCLHFTLNFSNKDKAILANPETKKEIIKAYLNKLGLEEQPFVAYQHNDAHHPHFHIVTTNINPDGKYIDVFKKLRKYDKEKRQNYAQEICRDIEKEFKLVDATKEKTFQKKIEPLNAAASFGKYEKRAQLQQILFHIHDKYKPTSYNEYEHVLDKYNISIDRGAEGSPMRKNNGVVYGIKGSEGMQVGNGIKSSILSGPFRHKDLVKTFEKNLYFKRQSFSKVARTMNKDFFNKSFIDYTRFADDMSKIGIETHLHITDDGLANGINFEDTKTGAFFSGDDFKLNKEDLFSKFSNFDLSYKEAKFFAKETSKVYRALKDDSKYYYESSFLRNLSANNLVAGLKNVHPNLSESKSKAIANSYLEYKQNNLDKIEKRETDYFIKNSKTYIDFIKKNESFSLDKKVEFLNQFDIGVYQHENGDTLFYSLEEDNILYGIRGNVNSTLRAEGEVPPVQLNKDYFSKQDKSLFRDIEQINERRLDPFQVNKLYYYRKENVNQWLDDKERLKIDKLLTEDYFNQVMKLAIDKNESHNPDFFARRGIFIEPVNHKQLNERYVAYYYRNDRLSGIVLNKEQSSGFKQVKYDEYAFAEIQKATKGGQSFRYGYLVELQQMIDKENYGRLEYLTMRMEKYSPDVLEKAYSKIQDNSNYVELAGALINELKNPTYELRRPVDESVKSYVPEQVTQHDTLGETENNFMATFIREISKASSSSASGQELDSMAQPKKKKKKKRKNLDNLER